jgi:hypothetical protein
MPGPGRPFQRAALFCWHGARRTLIGGQAGRHGRCPPLRRARRHRGRRARDAYALAFAPLARSPASFPAQSSHAIKLKNSCRQGDRRFPLTHVMRTGRRSHKVDYDSEILDLRSAGRRGQISISNWMVDRWTQLATRGSADPSAPPPRKAHERLPSVSAEKSGYRS